MIALKKHIELMQELLLKELILVLWNTCGIYLKAKRAELVVSGLLDPNISSRARLSKEPSLSLKKVNVKIM